MVADSYFYKMAACPAAQPPCSTLAEAMCTGGTFTVVDIWLGLQ